MMRIFFVFCLFFINIGVSCQTPYKSWTFDEVDFLKDSRSELMLTNSGKKSGINKISGAINYGIDLSLNGNDILYTSAYSKRIKDKISVSFFFNGLNFRYQSLPEPNFYLQYGYSYIRFKTTKEYGGKISVDDWSFELTGSGFDNYNYISDKTWHQFVFIIDLEKGFKKIYIDGVLLAEKSIPKGGQLILSNTDGFRYSDKIDELNFFSTSLSSEYITKEFNRLLLNSKKTNQSLLDKEFNSELDNKFDPLDFAPGFPYYTVSATEQLKKFPSPRFTLRHKMPRNFPWLDITYLHREYQNIGNKVISKQDPQKAIDIASEMYLRWNYFFEIPILFKDSKTFEREYSKKNSVYHGLVYYAKERPFLKTAGVIHQLHLNPSHVGFNSTTPFINSQKLPDYYYLKDSNNHFVKLNGKKVLSPLAPLDPIYKDAETASFYLSLTQQHLGRPLDFINENGEFFGHLRRKEVLEADPKVKLDIAKKGFSISQYNGWFLNKLDTAYKNEILRNLKWLNTRFTFYNVSAIQPNYWPDYSMRRTTNVVSDGIHYSTPSFYPAKPQNWRQNAGTYNGYGVIAEGRKTEIELGDKYFSPFVSAGWKNEEDNIRPAQWLALLKSMVMLGAEYFNVGYFNVTGTSGWPNGIGPNDPRGYAYQIAMPVFAQAIGSRVYDFLEKGRLLNPQPDLPSSIYSYRFKGDRENQLIMVRKLNGTYLIYGSIQPNSNITGNVPDEESVEISLEEMKVKFKIRRQGSVYYFNPNKKKEPIFFQLDHWHEAVHPYYWNKDMIIEAENAENLALDDLRIITEKKGVNNFDFDEYLTYLKLVDNDFATYSLSPNKDEEKKFAFNIKGKGVIVIKTNAGSKQLDVNYKNWDILDLKIKGSGDQLIISCIKGEILVDNIVIR